MEKTYIKLKILPESSSALFNSGGTGICISNNEGILLSLLELELFSTGGFGSSSKLFYKINIKPHYCYIKISN